MSPIFPGGGGQLTEELAKTVYTTLMKTLGSLPGMRDLVFDCTRDHTVPRTEAATRKDLGAIVGNFLRQVHEKKATPAEEEKSSTVAEN